jgi:hypothetical protein
MLGIALPADHPVWTAESEPLPIEQGDVLRAVKAPGWLISGTRRDGIVRVINHGTDHDVEGATTGDSPLYARIGYSTATAPLLDESGWTNPLDQSVTLVDPHTASRSHRTGFRTLTVRLDGEVGVAGSTGLAHWNDLEPGQRDHGSGRLGAATPAAEITVFSLVRGPWEIRLAASDKNGMLRMGGWPVTGDLVSHLLRLTGDGHHGEQIHPDGGPLGGPVRVPWLDWPVTAGEWVAALVGLSRDTAAPAGSAEIGTTDHGWEVRATWPDGLHTRTPLEIRTPLEKNRKENR